jgi:hypothetical protein
MNSFIEQELSRIVDTATRTVRASRSRKEQMREELLAHVREVFTEEFAHNSDERAALTSTARRFGIAGEVKSELQSSIPLMESLFLIPEKELLMSGKFWLITIGAIAVGPAIILPAMAMYRDDGIFNVMPFVFGGGILLAGLAMAAYGAIRLLHHS